MATTIQNHSALAAHRRDRELADGIGTMSRKLINKLILSARRVSDNHAEKVAYLAMSWAEGKSGHQPESAVSLALNSDE